MTEYLVTCEGNVREVYVVQASSRQEAMDRWADGDLWLSEATSVEPVSAELDDDE